MSSATHKIRGLGPRMFLWTTGFFIVSVIGVSSTVYFLLADSLRKTDREVIERLARTYEQTWLQQGPDALRQEITPEFSVSILNSLGKELFKQSPTVIDRDFEDEEEIEQVKAEVDKLPLKTGWYTVLILSGDEDNDLIENFEDRLRRMALKNDWSQLLPLIDNDSFEVFVSPLSGGNWMKIGRSSEEREEQLSRIRYIGFFVFIPFIFIGALLSFFLSRKVLAPIRDFARTIVKIREGNSALRVRDRSTGDEIDQLSREFNSLLDQNAVLVTNLKSVIDDVAHDLRTPLTRFRISAEDALHQNSNENRLKEALSDALENSESMLKLLNSIMDVSEAESKTMRIHRELVDLRELIEQVVELYQYTADDKNITVRIDGPPLTTPGDKTRLRQVFGNLLDNAIKYSPENSVVTFHLEAHGDRAAISLRDQGPGIPESDLNKIWDRLYRGDSGRSSGGLGIGLSLVKAIVAVHQGEVSVKNLSPSGSEFTVTLPISNTTVMKA